MRFGNRTHKPMGRYVRWVERLRNNRGVIAIVTLGERFDYVVRLLDADDELRRSRWYVARIESDGGDTRLILGREVEIGPEQQKQDVVRDALKAALAALDQ
jgi:hypothetical protein